MSSVVYVESNDPAPGANAILAYRRRGNGSLSLLGSFSSNGSGFGNPDRLLGPDDSDQNVVVHPDGTLLFAVNGGSDTIAVFRIHADGSLAHVEGSPFPSGGVQPVSLGLAGDRLYVVNKAEDPGRPSTDALPNYTGFLVDRAGGLSPIPQSTVTVARGASPTQALISPSGDLLFGADLLAGVLQSLRIKPDGRLEQRPPTPVDSSPPGPLGLAAHPTQPILYVGLPGANQLGIYAYDTAGTLRPVVNAANSGQALCWISRNHDGTRLYTSNATDNSLSVYDTTNPKAPVEIQHLALDSGGSPFQQSLDPTGQFLFVVSTNLFTQNPGDNVLHELTIAPDGTLKPAPPTTILPIPPGARPAGVAVTWLAGRFARGWV
ncbi:MAG: lactonase family protein [Egibacteraceae bacterium]